MTSVKQCFTQTRQSLYHPLWLSFERFTTLNYTNCVNYIDLYRYPHIEHNCSVSNQFQNSLFIPTVSIVVMGKFGGLRQLQLELHIVS